MQESNFVVPVSGDFSSLFPTLPSLQPLWLSYTSLLCWPDWVERVCFPYITPHLPFLQLPPLNPVQGQKVYSQYSLRARHLHILALVVEITWAWVHWEAMASWQEPAPNASGPSVKNMFVYSTSLGCCLSDGIRACDSQAELLTWNGKQWHSRMIKENIMTVTVI